MACSKARRKRTPQQTATAKKFTSGKVEVVAEPGDVLEFTKVVLSDYAVLTHLT